MEAAAAYVASLCDARNDEAQRREARRRRRLDHVATGNGDRQRLSLAARRAAVRHGANTISAEERALQRTLGATGAWWDSICARVLAERRKRDEVIALQEKLAHSALRIALRHESVAHDTVVGSDVQRLRELSEACEAEERRTQSEATREAVAAVLYGVDACIDFATANALPPSRENVLAAIALAHCVRAARTPQVEDELPQTSETAADSQVAAPLEPQEERRASEAKPAEAEEATETATHSSEDAASAERAASIFEAIFAGHPLRMTSHSFVQLVYEAYDRAAPSVAPQTALDFWRVPLFLLDGAKLSGKTLICGRAAAELGLNPVSSHELVTRALDAYAAERARPPTLFAAEHSGAAEAAGTRAEWRLSAVAAAGREAAAELRSGGPVPPALVARLAHLHADAAALAGRGVLFDGATLAAVTAAVAAVVPTIVHPFDRSLRCFRAAVPRPIARGDAEAEGVGVGDVPRVVREPTPSRAAGSGGRAASRGDGRRNVRRGVDLAALPPPVLPVVQRDALSAEEHAALEQYARESREVPLFAAVVYIRCATPEIFSRFAGLRRDRETGLQYHMSYYPPPPERAPFLESLDRTHTAAAQLHCALRNHEFSWELLRRWLCSHGAPVIDVEGAQSLDDVVRDVVDALRVGSEKFAAALALRDAARAAEERQRQIEESIAAQIAAREAERKRLIAIYTEAGVAIPRELEATDPMDTSTALPFPGTRSSNDRSGSVVYYVPPPDAAPVLLRAVEVLVSRYLEAYAWATGAVDVLSDTLLQYRRVALAVFARFWAQPDDKQERVNRFLTNYNALPPALRAPVACKEELHLLADQLREDLFRTLEDGAREAAARTEFITRRDAFIGPWCAAVCNVGAAVAQEEVERLVATVSAAQQHFAAVVGVPCAAEDVDVDIGPLRAGGDAAADPAPSAPRAKEKKAAGAKKALRVEDSAERSSEELFVDAVGKLVAGVAAFVERFATAANAAAAAAAAQVNEGGGGAPAAAAEASGRAALVLGKTLSFVREEAEAALERIAAVRRFVTKVLREGEAYAARMREDMLAESRERQRNQASAVNTAIYVIRCAIEEECPLAPMHLGRDTFFIDLEETFSAAASTQPPRTPHSTAEPTESESPSAGAGETARGMSPCALPCQSPSRPLSPLRAEGPMIHATLSAARLLAVIGAFRTVAPDGAVSRAEFMDILAPPDYEGAAAPHVRVRTLAELFAAFDPLGCGLIDWRELVVHLLLWCAPLPGADDAAESYYIPDCSVTQLLGTRAEVGIEPLSETDFLNAPIHFGAPLESERHAAYVRALWSTFSGDDGMLDPLPMLALLCMDTQPVRGAQKAFYVLGRHAEGSLSQQEMDTAFHVRATNPRRMCLPDVCSRENIAMLYEGMPLLPYQSVCENVMGSCLLNGTDAFHRRSFVVDIPM